MGSTRLIVATQNKDKFREIERLLKGIPFTLTLQSRLRKKFYLKENGTTFLANALKKALPISRAYPDDFVVGEDSGLEVVVLDGAPGIYSKRYSGKNANSLRNNKKLIRVLEGKAYAERRAQFRCCLVLTKGGKLLRFFEGTLKGRIHTGLLGEEGFGYDPVFFVPRFGKTIAQLPLSLKNKISHRAQAFAKLKRHLLACRKTS